MKRVVIVLCLLSACSSQQQVASTTEPGPSTSSTGSATTTTQTPSSTSTEVETTTTLAPLQSLSYDSVATFPYPVQLVAMPGEDHAYVVSKDGTIWFLEGGSVAEIPVLDISDRVRNSEEQGLLSAALHPDDSSRLFVHYSDGGGDTVVAEYSLSDPRTADPDSERRLLEVDQPASNHNGGMIQFALDGYLYVGLGDGGGSDDRFGNGQNIASLLGGLVRVDVDSGEALRYSYGLRNPWRFWIDGPTIYIADVGQNSFEEVNAVTLVEDLNFGWPITEGLHCFSPRSGCHTAGLTMPVVEVAHGDAGTCAITGGVLYRGSLIPEIVGQYFYSDYCGGYLRSFSFDGEAATNPNDWTQQVGVPGSVTGFGVDGAGEMYLTTESELLRVVAVR
ncbi:MAG TPA: PQQ-dependent sugar dehydrogenase [Acidimicrobiia bacterium]